MVGKDVSLMSSGKPNLRVRLLIVDDHAMLRESLSFVLDAQGFDVVGTSADGRAAAADAEQLQPDVILLDILMPELNGLIALRLIRKYCPAARVLILSACEDGAQVAAALRAGAHGYVVKSSEVDELILAIRAVARGNRYLSESLQYVAPEGAEFAATSPLKTGFDLLTTRECEVLQLLAEGHTQRAIGERLCVSHRTVEAHQANIRAKIGVRGRRDLVVFALRHGLISLTSVA